MVGRLLPFGLLLLACGDDSAASGAGGAGATGPTVSSGGSGGGDSGGASSGAGATGGMSGECTIPVDCPLPASECIIRTCIEASCGEELAVPGSIVAQQMPGDCERNVCDVAGEIVQEPDDQDLPTDGNECTVDTCANGEPAFAPAADGTPCSNGTTCTGGQCG